MTDFPSNWNVRPLGELVEVLDARRVPVSAKERAKRFGDVPYYGATGQVGWIDQALFNEPLVLLGEDGVQFFDGAKSKSYLIDGPAWVNNHAHVLRAGEDIDRQFLNYYLNAADYRGFANGTTRLKLTQAAMRRIPTPLPSLIEQRRIVNLLEDHLSRLDAADAYLHAAQLRNAVLHDQLLDSELAAVDSSDIPLSQLLAMGLSNGKSVPTQEGGFPVLRLTALRDGRIDLTERKPGAWTADDASRFLVERGDFLIARGNGSLRLVGRGGLVTDEPDAVAFPDTLIRARPDLTRIHPEFMAQVWNARGVRRQIETSARTTAGIYKVNQKDLADVLVPVPNLADQVRITAAVNESRDALSQLSFEVDRAIARSSALRRSLLAAAFSGRLTGNAADLSRAEEMINA